MHSNLESTKTINYRNIIRFNLPKDWVEEYDEELGGAFYKDAPNTGTLRLKVISINIPRNLRVNSSKEILYELTFNKESKIVELSNENAYNMFYEQGTDNDIDITIYYWSLVQAIKMNKTRLVNLSYTIPTQEIGKKHINEEIDFITKQVETMVFEPIQN